MTLPVLALAAGAAAAGLFLALTCRPLDLLQAAAEWLLTLLAVSALLAVAAACLA